MRVQVGETTPSEISSGFLRSENCLQSAGAVFSTTATEQSFGWMSLSILSVPARVSKVCATVWHYLLGVTVVFQVAVRFNLADKRSNALQVRAS